MNRKSGIIVITILALLIGLIISIQIGTTASSDIGGLIPVAKARGLEQELRDLRVEKEAIMQEYLELESRMKEIEEKTLSEDALLQAATKELER